MIMVSALGGVEGWELGKGEMLGKERSEESAQPSK